MKEVALDFMAKYFMLHVLGVCYDTLVSSFKLKYCVHRKSHVAISQFRGHNNNVEENGKRHVGQPETRSIQVLLLLIQHGANGLNLLAAQHVILVEPLLNPAAEAQAIGRVHRIGQAHKTLVHRFIVCISIETSL